MKIIEPSVELIDEIDGEQILQKLERCGKVSRKSELGDAESFVRSIIKRGHESVLEHASLTFHIICDRAIMAELTRHRLASFTVESTRYVKYDELTIIMPTGWEPTYFFGDYGMKYRSWGVDDELDRLIFQTELVYKTLMGDKDYPPKRDFNLPPEQARAVLPLCLATELYMTANLREWRHILKLRTDKAAHPQMRFIAKEILDVFKEKLPVIVEDIKP